MSARDKELTDLIQPLPRASWQADFPLSVIEHSLEEFTKDYGLNLAPDFQRGHVWTDQQRSAFMEALLRGALPSSILLIQWNAPHWEDHRYCGELPREIQILDGLQRLTTVRRFLAGRITAFGLKCGDFAGTAFSVERGFSYRLTFAVHTFGTRADLLKYYLDINSGGTPHTAAELARIREMLTA